MANTSVTQKLGKRIRLLRREAGLTQEQLALAAGTSQTHISSIETGQQGAGIVLLDKLARALGVSVADVMNYDYQLHENSRTSRH